MTPGLYKKKLFTSWELDALSTTPCFCLSLATFSWTSSPATFSLSLLEAIQSTLPWKASRQRPELGSVSNLLNQQC